jgi:hypothetical protein
MFFCGWAMGEFLGGLCWWLWVVPLVVLWGELSIYLGLGICTYKWMC